MNVTFLTSSFDGQVVFVCRNEIIPCDEKDNFCNRVIAVVVENPEKSSNAPPSSSSNGQIPPLPPLRSIMPPSSSSSVSTMQQPPSSMAGTATNGSMTTFLPAITEEPPITPIGHLV
ncbi:hypothetical protein BLA29_001660 [Euroglyphus maynei]|uniref:Uncharacterized protein n=1 Tax=Euroglyphus maynei TaxID=6958 RepID=A0A1Y3BPG0_EURMA|nr:hypothetical protein BLA29_001660 [Euroglyphus maynei]